MKVGGEYYWYHNDHLGTPQMMTADSGAVVWSAVYDSFGKATINTGVVNNNLRFAGQYFDKETGIHYNYHRYYDPTLGRYLRRDPYKGNINQPFSMHPYFYSESNPNMNIDEKGLSCKPFCIPFWRNTTEKILQSEKDTWLTGADFMCYYMVRQRDFVEKMTTTKYLCFYYKRKCDYCVFDKTKIETERNSHQEWTNWRKIDTFSDYPDARSMGHTGPVTVCPPRGENFKGQVPNLIP